MGQIARPKELPPIMFAFWGKSYAPDDAPAMHSVPHHCLDVAAAATVLLPIFPPPINIPAASVVALIALHDVGKFTRPFQAKVQALWPTASLGPFNTPPAGYPHDQTGYALMTGPLAELIAPLFGNWTAAARQPLLRAVAGHHGRPPIVTLGAAVLPRSVACTACLEAAAEFLESVFTLLAPPALPKLSARDRGRAICGALRMQARCTSRRSLACRDARRPKAPLVM